LTSGMEIDREMNKIEMIITGNDHFDFVHLTVDFHTAGQSCGLCP